MSHKRPLDKEALITKLRVARETAMLERDERKTTRNIPSREKTKRKNQSADDNHGPKKLCCVDLTTHKQTVKHTVASDKKTLTNSAAKSRIRSEKQKSVKRLKDKLAARARRAKLKEDPQAALLQKQKEHERYVARKKTGKLKTVEKMTKREKRNQQKKWKANSATYRQRQKVKTPIEEFVKTNTPATSQDATVSKRRVSGRKKIRRDKATAYRLAAQKTKEAEFQRRRAEKYRKQLARLKIKVGLKLGSPSPRTKVKKLLGRIKVPKPVKRKLEFAEALQSQLSSKFKSLKTDKEKQLFSKVICGKVLRKYRMLNGAKSFLSWKQYSKVKDSQNLLENTRKRKITAIGEHVSSAVKNFLEEDSNSRMLPGKQDVITRKKVKKQKRVLRDSLKNLHLKFKHESNIAISYVSFCRLRPFWVVEPVAKDRDTCVCIKHDNFQFIVDKLHFFRIIRHTRGEALCADVCCDENSKECMYRSCSVCSKKGIENLNNTITDLNTETTYFKWVKRKEIRKTKDGKDITVQLTSKEKVVCTVGDLLPALYALLKPFLVHVYNLRHQYSQIHSLKKQLCSNECVIHVDYSENYACKYASETQSMHFGASRAQATLHTGVLYYLSPETEGLHHLSFSTISSSLRHDASAVWGHLKPVINMVQEQLPNINTFHFLTDGPTTQYRNKTNFHLFAKAHVRHANIQNATWNFCEAGHGKGAPDGIGGTLKRLADKKVAEGSDIPDASALMQELKTLTKVKLFYITEADIAAIDDEIEMLTLKPIKGTMKLHQLTWSSNSPQCLTLRYLSCFKCPANIICAHYDAGGNWPVLQEPAEFSPEGAAEPEPEPNNEPIVVGNWVAVIYDDQWFPGEVVSVSADGNQRLGLTVDFMIRTGKFFNWPHNWPKQKDLQIVPASEILCKIQPPERHNNRFSIVAESAYIDNLLVNVLAS